MVPLPPARSKRHYTHSKGRMRVSASRGILETEADPELGVTKVCGLLIYISIYIAHPVILRAIDRAPAGSPVDSAFAFWLIRRH